MDDDRDSDNFIGVARLSFLRAIAAVSLGILLLAVTVGAANDPWPPAPTNLRVADVTEDSVTVQWGPTPVSNFGAEVITRKKVLAYWWPAEDPSGIDHYTIEWGTGELLGTSAVADFLVPVARGITSFRICVYATNGLGQDGPRSCGTYTRN